MTGRLAGLGYCCGVGGLVNTGPNNDRSEKSCYPERFSSAYGAPEDIRICPVSNTADEVTVGKVRRKKEKVVVRWWVVISTVAVLAGVPGAAAARLLSSGMFAASDQTQAFELDAVAGTAAKTSCSGKYGISVTVRWEPDNATLADGFEILRRDGDGKFAPVGVVSVAGDAQFSDDEVSPGATYTYAVRAVNSAWNGHRSTAVPVTVPSCK